MSYRSASKSAFRFDAQEANSGSFSKLVKQTVTKR